MIISTRRKANREPWPRFLLKMSLVAALIVAAGASFASRYRIAYDPQEVKCLAGYSVYLIDLRDTELSRDHVYAFSARGLQPFFDDGTQMGKILRGMPGDRIEITANEQVLINDELVGQGLTYAEHLGKTPADFAGETVLADNEYWFMGDNPMSFDSRYWGTVTEEQIIGRAYPLF